MPGSASKSSAGSNRPCWTRPSRPPARSVWRSPPRPARSSSAPSSWPGLDGRDGPTLGELGLALVWQPEGLPDGTRPKVEPAESLRILACFSLPDRANPLNLRRERYQLQRLVERLGQTKGRAVELRVIQYGATRETLKDALEDAAGWDLIQLSGHGGQGSLLLETRAGGTDRIDGAALAKLLRPAKSRLKLLILDACWSAAASHSAARAQLGLEPLRDPEQAAQGAAPAESAAQTALPSLAEDLARALDCAALAMRFPVGDAFATDLTLALYEKLLDRGQALPAALKLALDEALGSDPNGFDPAPGLPPLSPFTPILVGPRAAGLKLVPPARAPGEIAMPRTGLHYFPPEPPRFVGRLGPMLRASLALAPESPQRGVCFYGMAGAGKTACALETAYRHEWGRFADGQVWYRGPEQGREIATALGDLLLEIERQLGNPNLGLAVHLDEPEKFRAYILPRLKGLLERHALLLVLDNLENLLTQAGDWRDPLWGDLIAVLFAHGGHSRTVLTSRRLPAGLPDTCLAEPIHALSFAESVLLARELPRLARLFADDPGRALLRRTLRVVQGHPKLMELADALAADRAALACQVAATEPRSADREAVLDAFFQPDSARGADGESAQDESGFVETLFEWTRGASAALDPAARLLLAFLCRLEPEDRSLETVQTNWNDFLDRLQREDPGAAAPALALALPDLGLPAGLARLATAGLIEPERPVSDATRHWPRFRRRSRPAHWRCRPGSIWRTCWPRSRPQQTRYRIHPGVAEAVLAETPAAVAAAADTELGNLPHRPMPARTGDRDPGRRPAGGGRLPARGALSDARRALGGGSDPAGADDASGPKPRVAGLRHPAPAAGLRGDRGDRSGTASCRRAGPDAAGRRPRGRGGAGAAAHRRRVGGRGAVPARLGCGRRPAEPAEGRRAARRGARAGGGDGRLHPVRRSRSLDPVGRRGPASTDPGRAWAATTRSWSRSMRCAPGWMRSPSGATPRRRSSPGTSARPC